MKRTLTISLVLAAVTVIAFGASPLVNAETAGSTATRCTVSKPKLVTLSDKLDAAQQTHEDVYADIDSHVQALVTSATAQKYVDVAKITAAKKAFATKITAFTAKSTAYSTALKAAADAACGESDETYTTALTAARTAYTAAHTATLAVTNSFSDGVAPTLTNYATWLKTEAATNQGAN